MLELFYVPINATKIYKKIRQSDPLTLREVTGIRLNEFSDQFWKSKLMREFCFGKKLAANFTLYSSLFNGLNLINGLGFKF